MYYYSFFKCVVLIVVVVITMVETATVTVQDDDKKTQTYNVYKDSDLSYSDLDTLFQESRERLYRNFRDYGVPADVAHMYVPRGMTVGDLFGKGKGRSEISDEEDSSDDSASTFDPWSVVWYIGSFGGLIAFFLVVSCSEWCCLRNRQQSQPTSQQTTRRTCPHRVRATATTSTDTPPPAYHLFAPPPYDSVTYGEKTEKYDVYVVPVHAVSPNFIGTVPQAERVLDGADVPPPEYTAVSMPAP